MKKTKLYMLYALVGDRLSERQIWERLATEVNSALEATGKVELVSSPGEAERVLMLIDPPMVWDDEPWYPENLVVAKKKAGNDYTIVILDEGKGPKRYAEQLIKELEKEKK